MEQLGQKKSNSFWGRTWST